jgi:hypothetical protein
MHEVIEFSVLSVLFFFLITECYFDHYIAPNRMLITAAIISPPLALLAVTTMAPTHTMRAQEQKLTVKHSCSNAL